MARRTPDVEILRQNGEIVMGALNQLHEPANMRTVVNHIAQNLNVNENEIRAPVQDVLKTGYTYGFIEKDKAKYFIGPTDRRKSRGRSRSKSRAKSRSKSRSKGGKRRRSNRRKSTKIRKISIKQEKF